MQDNNAVSNVYSTHLVPVVEICGKLSRADEARRSGPEAGSERPAASLPGNWQEVRACSACAGDYEDPDRTVWSPEESSEAGEESPPEPDEKEFPAEW